MGNVQPIKLNTLVVSKKTWNTTIEFILSSRLIGPPKDWAYAQWFIQGDEESIYGKLFKNNMDGLSSFYPVLEGIDYIVNSDTEVALFLFINVHSFQEYQCKVKTFKKFIVKTLLWVHILCTIGWPLFARLWTIKKFIEPLTYIHGSQNWFQIVSRSKWTRHIYNLIFSQFIWMSG